MKRRKRKEKDEDHGFENKTRHDSPRLHPILYPLCDKIIRVLEGSEFEWIGSFKSNPAFNKKQQEQRHIPDFEATTREDWNPNISFLPTIYIFFFLTKPNQALFPL